MSFSILAVGRPGMGEEATVERAATLAAQEHAALTLMCVWAPARLVSWARLAGVDPAELVHDHAEQSSAWIRGVVARLPDDVSVRFACRKGVAKRHVAQELRSGHYDVLVVSRALLGARCLARLEHDHPDLRIELVETTQNLAVA
jgi:hypothetical protein